jgi:thymidylate kinase
MKAGGSKLLARSSRLEARSSGLEASGSKLAAKGPPLLISFSGLDGSGKSTQIANLQQFLQNRGQHCKLLAFWDDVVVLSRYREGFVHKVYGSERGIGAPGQPVNRRDKNVRKWYLTLARHGLYLLDALHLAVVVAAAKRSGVDAIIMDRYIYDELANLPLANPATRIFVRAVHGIVPRPDLAYLLDVDPEQARQRKPEYPLDFLYSCRRSYLRLAHMLGHMTVITPLDLADAVGEVRKAVEHVSLAHREAVPEDFDRVEAV